jgi:hypothetical protein
MSSGWFQTSKWRPCLSVLPKGSVLLCVFVVKRTQCKWKCFLFTVGSVCRVKRFTAGSRNNHPDGKRFADDKEVEKGEAEVAETTIEKLLRLCCGFRRTGKATGRVSSMLVKDMTTNEFLLQVRMSHILHFIVICVLFTDSPLYKICPAVSVEHWFIRTPLQFPRRSKSSKYSLGAVALWVYRIWGVGNLGQREQAARWRRALRLYHWLGCTVVDQPANRGHDIQVDNSMTSA